MGYRALAWRLEADCVVRDVLDDVVRQVLDVGDGEQAGVLRRLDGAWGADLLSDAVDRFVEDASVARAQVQRLDAQLDVRDVHDVGGGVGADGELGPAVGRGVEDVSIEVEVWLVVEEGGDGLAAAVHEGVGSRV